VEEQRLDEEKIEMKRNDGHGKISSGIRRVRHVLRVQWWNISWWVAFFFTLGSIIWVLNAFAAFLPFSLPSHFESEQSTEQAKTLAGWTAWVGATIFEMGSVCGMLEAWNRGREILVPPPRLVDKLETGLHELDGNRKNNSANSTHRRRRGQKWIWFSLDPTFFREAGFLAAFFQFWAATVFWISGYASHVVLRVSLFMNMKLTSMTMLCVVG
jgi:hypothetical protein